MTKKVKDMSPEEYRKHRKARNEYQRRYRAKKRANRPMPKRWRKLGNDLFESYNKVFPNE